MSRQPCLILVKKKTSCMKMFLGNFSPYRKPSTCLSFLLLQVEITSQDSQDSTQHRSKIFQKKKIPGNFLVIQWLGLYASTPWVPSLVEEQRSYKQCGAEKRKIPESSKKQNLNFLEWKAIYLHSAYLLLGIIRNLEVMSCIQEDMSRLCKC